MGQKVNSITFRKGFTNFWENSWYINIQKYNKNFFQDYNINLYLTCILRRLRYKLERVVIKQLNKKIYISFFYYRLYYIKIRKIKKKQRIIKILRRLKYKKRYLKRMRQGNFYFKNKKRKKQKIRLFRIIKYKMFRIYRNIIVKKLKKKKYLLKYVLNKVKRFINFKQKLYFFCINLNKFLILNLKKKKFLYILRKNSRNRKNRSFFDTILIANISFLLKNPKFFSDYIGLQFYYIRKRYPPYFRFLTKLLSTIKEIKYSNYIKGYRLRIGGKVKGRKKNRADYFLISRGKLALMTLSNLIYYSFSIGRTKFGILGIKFWISYNKKNFSKSNKYIFNFNRYIIQNRKNNKFKNYGKLFEKQNKKITQRPYKKFRKKKYTRKNRYVWIKSTGMRTS